MSIFIPSLKRRAPQQKITTSKHLRAELLADSTEAARVQWLKTTPLFPRV